MNTVLVLIISALFCLSLATSRPYLDVFNEARQSVTPPCDYRAKDSPCFGRSRNSLPRLRWSSELEKAASDYLLMCPQHTSLNLPQGQSQLFIKTSVHADARTAEQMLTDYARKWSILEHPDAYNAVTGLAPGSDGRAFKTIVNARNREVGCAVNLNCAGRRLVACNFRVAAAPGPAYPVLVKDAAVTDVFRNSIISWVNHARRLAYPRPSTPLQQVTWDDALAASAQSVADRQTSHPAVYEPSLDTVQTVLSLRYTQVNPAFAFAALSFSRGVFYNIRTNTCRDTRGRERRRCGLYTQLVGKNVSKIGCGLAWKNGNTFVVCQFDASYSKAGVATTKPY